MPQSASIRDMRDVVIAVPRIKCRNLIQPQQAVCRMAHVSLPLIRGQRSQQSYPSPMQRFKQHRQCFNRRVGRITKLSPGSRIVRLFDRFIFRQRPV